LRTSRRIKVSFIQHFDEHSLFRLGTRVHFEVSSNEELARHDEEKSMKMAETESISESCRLIDLFYPNGGYVPTLALTVAIDVIAIPIATKEFGINIVGDDNKTIILL